MSTSRRALAETYEAQDLIIQAAQDVKREATKAYREHLDSRGMDKEAVKAEVEGFKKAFRRKMEGQKKGAEAVEHVDAIADEIYLEITSPAPRATRVASDVPDHDEDGVIIEQEPQPTKAAGQAQEAGHSGASLSGNSLPGAEGAEDREPIQPTTANEVPAQDSGGNQASSDFDSKPLGKSNAARPASVDADVNDGTPAGETGDEVVTGGESAASNITTFKAKPLRPHCLRPEKCGGQGKEHCWSCKNAMNEAGAA